MTARKPEEDPDNETEAGTVEIMGAEALKQALATEKEKAEASLAGWQRAQADFLNYKRRAEQEKEEAGSLGKSALVLTLLPVLDDLERAFGALPEEVEGSSWASGFRLIERKLRTTLEAQGLTPIKALGEPFDPRYHEAAMQGEGEEGIVVGELEKGYKFGDRVVRPSKVVVSNGQMSDRGRRRKRSQIV